MSFSRKDLRNQTDHLYVVFCISEKGSKKLFLISFEPFSLSGGITHVRRKKSFKSYKII